jgi:hypothetical protein
MDRRPRSGIPGMPQCEEFQKKRVSRSGIRAAATRPPPPRERERDPHCSELVPDRWGIVILTPPDHQPNVNKYEQQPGAIIYCSPLITSVALSLSQPLKSLSVCFYFVLVRICDQENYCQIYYPVTYFSAHFKFLNCDFPLSCCSG